MTASRAVVVEADGGSRGNPGPAAYGAVLRDAETGAVIAEDAETLGVASNNVAEYAGLVAGLKLAADLAPGASVEVRMDSKLVVEQMSGRWQIKHPDMQRLAADARAVAPPGTSYTWVPRLENSHADRLANEALDGLRHGVVVADREEAEGTTPQQQYAAWARMRAGATTVVLVRHGVTPHTVEKRFSGGLASANPGLSEEGRAQVRATAEWLSAIKDDVDVVLASPVRRTLESAEIVAEVLGAPLETEPGFAEMEFGVWDGLTFLEVAEKHPDELDKWLGSLDHPPGGGESFREVEARVLAALDRTLTAHAGRTIVVVSHVTPIKTLVAHALGAPLESIYRLELAPASVSVLSYFSGGSEEESTASLRLFNARPTSEVFLAP